MKLNNEHTHLAVHITPHHLSLSPAIEQYAVAKLARAPRIAGDALSADIVLRLHHGRPAGERFTASIRLALPGRDLYASADHADLYAAIDGAVDRIARLCRKRKTRMLRAADGRWSRRRVADVAILPNNRLGTLA